MHVLLLHHLALALPVPSQKGNLSLLLYGGGHPDKLCYGVEGDYTRV